jgi:hypothetical protein
MFLTSGSVTICTDQNIGNVDMFQNVGSLTCVGECGVCVGLPT